MKETRPGVPFWSKLMDVAVHSTGNYILAPLLQNVPNITPLALKLGFQQLRLQYGVLQPDEVVRTPWAVHYRDGIDLMPVYDIEFAFPIDITDPVAAVKAIRAVVKITKEYADGWKFPCEGGSDEAKKNHFPLTLCMEMRVMKKSECLLCPATVGDDEKMEHIAYIEVLSTSGTPGYEPYFKEIGLAWKELGGTPHWHKQWVFLNSDTFNIFDYIRKQYGDNLTTFENVLTSLKYDPDNLFTNTTMGKLFQK